MPPTDAPGLPPVPTQRLFGVDVADLDLAGAVARIIAWSVGPPARIVVTTNLDHVMKLEADAAFRDVYARADLVTADGMPFVWLSRLEGAPLRERVTGSDMILPLMAAAAEAGRRVFLFGSTMERLDKAARRLTAENPDLAIVGAYAPPFGFDRDTALDAELLALLRSLQPDIVLVALGAPKQELWSARMAAALGHGVFVNIGGGLDFLAGAVQRSPRIMQRLGLEWLWRALSEPMRLGPRYLRILLHAPRLYLQHRRTRRDQASM